MGQNASRDDAHRDRPDVDLEESRGNIMKGRSAETDVHRKKKKNSLCFFAFNLNILKPFTLEIVSYNKT